MERVAVSSSRVSSVGWANNILEVEFKGGAVYHYFDVSRSEYESLLNASSIGHQISVIDKAHHYARII